MNIDNSIPSGSCLLFTLHNAKGADHVFTLPLYCLLCGSHYNDIFICATIYLSKLLFLNLFIHIIVLYYKRKHGGGSMRAKNSSQCHHTDKYQKGHDQCYGQEVYLG